MRAWREEANGSSSWISTSPRPSVAPSDQVVGHPGLVPGGVLDQQPRLELRRARPGPARRRRTCRCASWRGDRPRLDRAAPRRDAGRAARSRRPTSGTGTARSGSRTSGATETGSSIGVGLLLQLERDQRGADLDLVARLEHLGPLDPAAVQTRAVGRARGRSAPTSRRGDGPRRACGRRWGRRASRRTAGCGPSVAPAGPTTSRLPSSSSSAVSWRGARALLERLGHPPGRAVDHRAARTPRPPARCASSSRRADHPGLDPELPEAEPIVGLELDHRPRHQRQPLPARVLEQVAAQLGGQRVLVVGEPLAVARATGNTRYSLGT